MRQPFEECPPGPPVVRCRRSLDRIGQGRSGRHVVQLIEAAKAPRGRNIEQPHTLPGHGAVPAFGHRGADGALPRRNDERGPAGHGSRRAGTACPLFAASVAQAVDNRAHLARIAFADFVQREQAVIEQRRRAFHAVGGRPPAPAVARPAPHRTGGLKNRCLAGRGIAHEMQPAAFGVGALEQRPREGCRQRQQEQRIAHGPRCDFCPPAVEGAGLPVLFMPALARLEDHARRIRADYRVRQHENGIAPSDLQRAAHPLEGCPLLQVAGEGVSCRRVDFKPHRQQFAAQVGTVAAQQLHRHGPRPPAARRVLEAQQPPEVVVGAVEGLGLDMQRPAYPSIDGGGVAAAPWGDHVVVPHARPQLAPGVEQCAPVIHPEAGAFIVGDRRNCRLLAFAAVRFRCAGEQFGQRRNAWNVCRSACRSVETRAVTGFHVRNVWNVTKQTRRGRSSRNAFRQGFIFQRAIAYTFVPFWRSAQYRRGFRFARRNVWNVQNVTSKQVAGCSVA